MSRQTAVKGMAHDGSMATLGTLVKPAVSELQGAAEDLQTAVRRMAKCIKEADAAELGEGLIQIREVGIDPLEAVFASGLRRFDKSGEYKADGALSAVAGCARGATCPLGPPPNGSASPASS